MPHQNPYINLETAQIYKVTFPHQTPSRCVTKCRMCYQTKDVKSLVIRPVMRLPS